MFLSLIGIWALFLLSFLIFRLVPCSFSYKFSQKLWLRRHVTFHDTVETTILPIILFGSWQLIYMLPILNHLWVYFLSFLAIGMILTFPFVTIILVYNRRKIKTTIEVNQDLLQDCRINTTEAYHFYLSTMYKKIIIGILLADAIPASFQLYLILIVNILHLVYLCYIAINGIFSSALKVLILLINGISIIGIEIIIITYNWHPFGRDHQIALGVSCVYLTALATIAGVIEIIVRIVEIICQKVDKYS